MNSDASANLGDTNEGPDVRGAPSSPPIWWPTERSLDDVTSRPCIYIRNTRGPRTKPCGTPELTREDEVLVLTWTNWQLFVRSNSIQASTLMSMFRLWSLCRRSTWGTLSKAFGKTRNMQYVLEPRSRVTWRSWVNVRSWVSQEYNLQKPCWAKLKKKKKSLSWKS